MKKIKRYTAAGVIFVLTAGSLAHFLYGWTGNNQAVGFFVPVNESVWEHMKLVFFPMLLYGSVLLRRICMSCRTDGDCRMNGFCNWKEQSPCIVSAYCLGLLAGTLLVPVLFYAYTYVLGTNIFILDLGTFILSVLAGFWLFHRFALSCRLKALAPVLCVLVGVWLAVFLLFTYHAPRIRIFEAPVSVFFINP